MTEEEIATWATKLIQRFDNTKIVGAGGEWSGNARQGFMFNPRPRSPSETTVITSGACCPEEGDCFISTQVVCEGGGGTYQGDDTTCDPDPCPPPTPTGACCVGTDCSIETESDCTGMGGTYQGDDTACDPNPCANGACCKDGDCTITTEAGCDGEYQGDGTTCEGVDCGEATSGACCVGSDCSIQTPSDCTGMGGTYQGDDTTCDPDPCTTHPPCGCDEPFSAFDSSSRKFLTATRTVTGSQDSVELTEHWEWSSTKIEIACGDCMCSGSGSATAPSFPDGCTFTAIDCFPSCPDGLCRWPDGTSGCGWIAAGGDCVGPFGISNMGACCPGDCCGDGGVVIGPTERITTYNCPDVGPCYAVVVTVTETLSDECTPP